MKCSDGAAREQFLAQVRVVLRVHECGVWLLGAPQVPSYIGAYPVVRIVNLSTHHALERADLTAADRLPPLAQPLQVEQADCDEEHQACGDELASGHGVVE